MNSSFASSMSLAPLGEYGIPVLGYGTWQASGEELESALHVALEVGYRHIDTAYVYNNEHIIGEVIKNWMDAGRLTREELFLVTKLPVFGNKPHQVEYFLDASLRNLQTSYVDLYLCNYPFATVSQENPQIDLSTDILAVWKAMENLVDNGKTKAIGVSNFNANQIQRLLSNSRIPPLTNQLEVHAYSQQPELVGLMKENNVIVTAYSPLGSLGLRNLYNLKGFNIELPNILVNPVVTEMARKYRKTEAQILLRHSIQKGIVVIPKSVKPKRVVENSNIFDFELEDEDVIILQNLDKGLRFWNFSKIYPGSENHPEFPFYS